MHMKKIHLIFVNLMLSMVIIFTQCISDIPASGCIEGKVLGYDRCFGVFLIQVITGDLNGNTLTSFGTKLENVVQYPSRPDVFGSNVSLSFDVEENDEIIIFFNYRDFNPEKDHLALDPYVFCTANVGPHDLPKIIITNFSTSNCPSDHEK